MVSMGLVNSQIILSFLLNLPGLWRLRDREELGGSERRLVEVTRACVRCLSGQETKAARANHWPSAQAMAFFSSCHTKFQVTMT
jgi:hypothetical protein